MVSLYDRSASFQYINNTIRRILEVWSNHNSPTSNYSPHYALLTMIGGGGGSIGYLATSWEGYNGKDPRSLIYT